MQPVIRSLVVGALVACATVHDARAQERRESAIYVVQQGDTCAGIATRFYGDARRVDLIHEANDGMGPPPHSLRPGQRLVLPPKPGDPGAGKPDATLTRIRNQVEITAGGVRPGKPDDPLFRGNRVGTKAASAADVTFRDETQVKLGEHSLVVILGDTNARAAPVSGAELTLVTGGLRARLGELAGESPAPARVTTDSGVVAMKDGEAQVTSDEVKTTRVAVYRGGSSLTAQKKTVDVNDGFGSKAVKGRPPTPPAPLPPAPEWTTAAASVVLSHAPAEVAFAFQPSGSAGPAAAEWHVQLARDAAFDDLLVDRRTPIGVRMVEAKNLPPGTYFARASAIDADRFEGKWSAVARTTVGRIGLEQFPGRRARVTVDAAALACRLDGTIATFPAEIDRDAPHAVACEDTDGAGKGSLDIPMQPIGRARVLAETLATSGRSGTLRMTVTDEAGSPVSRLRPVAEGPPELRIGELRPAGAAGAYLATFTWTAPPRPSALRVRLLGDATADTNVVAFEPDAAAAPAPLRERGRLELAAAGAFSYRGPSSFGAGFDVDARAALPLARGALLVGASGGWTSWLPLDRSSGTHVSGSAIDVRLVTGYRFGAGQVAPYVTFGPELLRQRVEESVGGVRREGREWLVGAGAAVGVEAAAGPGAVFAEARGRVMSSVAPETPSLDGSAGALLFGYRWRP